MYEIFEKLLKEKGLTAYRVAQETGVSPWRTHSCSNFSYENIKSNHLFSY